MISLPSIDSTQLFTNVKQASLGGLPQLAAGLGLSFVLVCFPSFAKTPASVPGDFIVVAERQHSTERFTQGLEIDRGFLYESTGRYGHSAVYRTPLRGAGQELVRLLKPKYFGEGITVFHGTIFQLTWREGQLLTYDSALKPGSSFPWAGEGWGIAYAASFGGLVVSDGSALLQVRDPVSLRRRHEIVVRFDGRPVERLNELEEVCGRIYANVWHNDRVAVVDEAGRVSRWIDFSPLRSIVEQRFGKLAPEAVLNGMAWDEETGHLFITGKNWPLMFELKEPTPDSHCGPKPRTNGT